MDHFTQGQEKVREAIAQFPAEFGLRAFPGRVFKLSYFHSYVSDDGVMLYTLVKDGDSWHAFCKGTPDELQKAIVKI